MPLFMCQLVFMTTRRSQCSLAVLALACQQNGMEQLITLGFGDGIKETYGDSCLFTILLEVKTMHKVDMMTIIIAVACISGLILVFCFGCMLTNSVELSVDCFAVDSAGKLFVGSNGQIRVYENAQLKYVISEYKGVGDVPVKGAIFTIESNDMITMVTGRHIILMDLMGNVQEVKKTDTSSIYSEMQGSKNRFMTQSGDVYTMHNVLGRTCIQKNSSELVYQISAFSLLVKVLLVLSVLGFVVTVPIIIVHILREQMAFR